MTSSSINSQQLQDLLFADTKNKDGVTLVSVVARQRCKQQRGKTLMDIKKKVVIRKTVNPQNALENTVDAGPRLATTKRLSATCGH